MIDLSGVVSNNNAVIYIESSKKIVAKHTAVGADADTVVRRGFYGEAHFSNIYNKTEIDSLVGSSGYQHDQITPNAVWSISHNLGFYPDVSIKDSIGNEIFADVFHNSANQVTITFTGAETGRAYFK